VPEAELQNLHKKRKLVERQCAPACALVALPRRGPMRARAHTVTQCLHALSLAAAPRLTRAVCVCACAPLLRACVCSCSCTCRARAWKTYRLGRGARFALSLVKPAAELSADMMKDGSWRTTPFKPYNFAPGAGAPPAGGHLHPLLKVREQFRQIFLTMGFAEMATGNFVESSFWNFDTLIQPQQHPARDAHDTFFVSNPPRMLSAPEDYVARVRTMHEHGGHGSCGYRYAWKRSEADKNILRTHTTAVSARLLHALAQKDGPWTPVKAFSIDRVFRNEAVDKTHLAEFHQVEGVMADRGLTLGHLIGVLHEFFRRLGMEKLRFKPAYNPYTEPSMEIFAFHPMLNRWVEVGNSGMFRPEMLRPMGLGIPEDVNVIAWGLSLERCARGLHRLRAMACACTLVCHAC
jgi:phenylalanyl-tRNA synthetase alpha chain